MFKTLFSRMLVAYLAASIAVIAILGVIASAIIRNHYLNAEKANLMREADEISYIITEEYLDAAKRPIAREKLFAIVRQFDALLQLYFDDPTIGRRSFYDYRSSDRWSVCSDTDFFELVDNENEASESYIFFADILDEYTDMRTLSVCTAVVLDGQELGTMVLHSNMDDIYSALSTLYMEIWGSVVFAVLITGVITLIITKHITKPVSHMTDVVNSFSKGNYDSRVMLKQNDELGRLGTSFNEMADKVAGLEKARREFVANVSHELRSPLTSMRGFLEAMEDGVIPAEEHTKYLGVVLDENKRMTAMVNDLLDIARIESGQYKLNRTVFDAVELIGRVLITFESRINDKHIAVETNVPHTSVYVNADSARIGQVLHNLIDNAIKFSPESGGRLNITLNADRHKANVTVANTGAGISPEDISNVFDRFFKTEKAHTYKSDSGTGLGLSIAKLIMDQHNEKIEVSSESGETKFTFTLKRVSAPIRKTE